MFLYIISCSEIFLVQVPTVKKEKEESKSLVNPVDNNLNVQEQVAEKLSTGDSDNVNKLQDKASDDEGITKGR